MAIETKKGIEGAGSGCGRCVNGYVTWGKAMSAHGLHSVPCPTPSCEPVRVAHVLKEGASARVGAYQ